MNKLQEEINLIEGKLKYAQNFKQELHQTFTRINTEIVESRRLIQSTINLLGSVITVRS